MVMLSKKSGISLKLTKNWLKLAERGDSRFTVKELRIHTEDSAFSRVAPVRFGSVTVRAWDDSSGSGFRFRRFL